MMSDSVDFPAAKKKSYTEKDFFIITTIELSRLYVNKENGEERLWKDRPKVWDEAELGPWRSPTGQQKDTVAVLKKKCDFLIKNMPKDKKEKMDKVKINIELVSNGNKARIHNIVCLLHWQEQLKKDYLQVENLNNPAFCKLVQETKSLMDERMKELETVLQSNAGPISNRKRSMGARGTCCKKPRGFDSCVPTKETPNRKTLKRIFPKPTTELHVLGLVVPVIQPHENSLAPTQTVPSLNSPQPALPVSLLHGSYSSLLQQSASYSESDPIPNTEFQWNKTGTISSSPHTDTESIGHESDNYSSDLSLCPNRHSPSDSGVDFSPSSIEFDKITSSHSQHSPSHSDLTLDAELQDTFYSQTETDLAEKSLQTHQETGISFMPYPDITSSESEDWLDTILKEQYNYHDGFESA